jgi:hypothetical protein
MLRVRIAQGVLLNTERDQLPRGRLLLLLLRCRQYRLILLQRGILRRLRTLVGRVMRRPLYHVGSPICLSC